MSLEKMPGNVPEQQKNAEKYSEDVIEAMSLLEDAVYDRLSLYSRTEDEALLEHELEVLNPDLLTDLSPEEQKNAIQQIKLLSAMNGHKGSMLRKLVENGTSEEALHLKKLYDWSYAMGKPGGVVEDAVVQEPMEYLSEVPNYDSFELYERLRFKEQNTYDNDKTYAENVAHVTGQALGIENENPKWVELVGVLFDTEKKDLPKVLRTILETTGFIPADLYTKKKFRSLQHSPEKAFNVLAALKKLESDKVIGDQARYERGKLMSYVVSQNVADQNKVLTKGYKNIELDSNGILINLRDYNAHIPFGLIDDGLLEKLEKDNWTDENVLQELRAQRAKENSSLDEYREYADAQIEDFLDDGATVDSLIDSFRYSPFAIADRIVREDLIIPDVAISSVVARYGQEGQYKLMQVAEAIGTLVSEEVINKGAPLTFDLKKLTQKKYDYRAKILNSPKYYNVVKIVRGLLEMDVSGGEYQDITFFKGEYTTDRSDPHSYFESVHKGIPSKILVNERKHLRHYHRPILNNLPTYEKADYERIESTLAVFDHLSYEISELERFVSKGDFSDIEGVQRTIQKLMYITLTNVSEFNAPIATSFHKLFIDTGYKTLHPSFIEEHLVKVLDIVYFAKEKFASWIHDKIVNHQEFKERENPYVKVKTIKFDEEFRQMCEDNCDPAHGYTPDLYTKEDDHTILPTEIRIADISEDYLIESPSDTVPHEVTEEALDALRLDRNRILINVIGGARATDDESYPGAELLGPKDLSEVEDKLAREDFEVYRKYLVNFVRIALKNKSQLKTTVLNKLAYDMYHIIDDDPNMPDDKRVIRKSLTFDDQLEREFKGELNVGDPDQQYADAIARVGENLKANVFVPGTQSGVGNHFARINAEQQRRAVATGAKRSSQAHYVAISPAANTYAGEESYSNPAPRRERYAPSVDTARTPTNGDWHLRGLDRLIADYIKHIAYMEAIMKAASEGKPRLTVIGNGGLWSIAEANEAILNGFDIVFVRDSGRFGTVGAEIVARLDEFNHAWSDERIVKQIYAITEESHSLSNDDFYKQSKLNNIKDIKGKIEDLGGRKKQSHLKKPKE